MSDEFEWDEEKARSNLAKHKVSFEIAVRIFLGPRLEVLDAREGGGEERYISLGEVDARCLVVVHTPRGERTRIISARKASSHERKKYYETISSGSVPEG